MKKRIITLSIIMMIALAAFAQRPNFPPRPMMRGIMTQVEKNPDFYKLEVDIRQLASTLELNETQWEMTKVIMEQTNNKIQQALDIQVKTPFDRMRQEKMLNESIGTNLDGMKKILTKKQFKQYRALLLTTIKNNIILQ